MTSGEVQVWRADLDHPPLSLAVLTPMLSADEQERASRFRRPRDRDRFIVARGLLRVLLGLESGCPPESIQFRYSAFGKPEIGEEGTRLRFNLSHSEGLALFALAIDWEIGVDIERMQPGLAVESLAARYFPPIEAAALQALPPALRTEGFFRTWVRHEAYLKSLGTGFSCPSDSREDKQAVFYDLPVGDHDRAALVITAMKENGRRASNTSASLFAGSREHTRRLEETTWHPIFGCFPGWP